MRTIVPNFPKIINQSAHNIKSGEGSMPKNARRPMVIVVACVLESAEGTVLLARRPEGRPLAGLWEFPGGKVEPEEKVEDSLIRELGEELGVVIDSDDLAPLTFVSHAYGDFNLLMPLYLCRKWTGEVMAREGQELNWVRPNELHRYPMPPADEPLKASLGALLQRCGQ
jgi:8-oxo-dGTP diphosphatase